MFLAKYLLPLLVAATLTQGALIPLSKAKVAANGFTYIGSLKNLNPATGTYRNSLYYLSPNDASWEDAREDCRTFMGPTGMLLQLETEAEQDDFITWYHTEPGTASNYWTGGQWNVTSSHFEWVVGNIPIESWFRWGPGEPVTSLPVSRVEFRSLADTFHSEFDSTDSRYICEVDLGDGGSTTTPPTTPEPTTTTASPPEPCYEDNDLIIVVDSSGSIGAADYAIAMTFTEQLAMAWAANAGSRVSIITYADTVTLHAGLAASLSPIALQAIIRSIVYTPGGGTGTDIALDAVLAEFTANPRGVPRNMVLLTDGESSYPAKTLVSAAAVTAAGIDGFAVGITSHVSPAELLAIAGNDPTHVFTTPDFGELLALLKRLSEIVCP